MHDGKFCMVIAPELMHVQNDSPKPPKGWQLTENPGDGLLVLTRQHNNETIEVTVSVNDQVRHNPIHMLSCVVWLSRSLSDLT